MAAELHVGDIGTEIQALILDQAETIVDLSGATVLQYILYKPSKTIVELNCSLVNDGTDGLMEFITDASTLNEAGFYSLQGYIEVSTNKWHTDTIKFRVYPNLN